MLETFWPRSASYFCVFMTIFSINLLLNKQDKLVLLYCVVVYALLLWLDWCLEEVRSDHKLFLFSYIWVCLYHWYHCLSLFKFSHVRVDVKFNSVDVHSWALSCWFMFSVFFSWEPELCFSDRVIRKSSVVWFLFISSYRLETDLPIGTSCFSGASCEPVFFPR